MDQAGIAEFNVARIFNNQVLPDGNQIADLGVYTRKNEQTLRIGVLAPTIWAGTTGEAWNYHYTRVA
jgi:hypothetical protein